MGTVYVWATGSSLCQATGSSLCQATGSSLRQATGSSLRQATGSSLCQATGSSLSGDRFQFMSGNRFQFMSGNRFQFMSGDWHNEIRLQSVTLWLNSAVFAYNKFQVRLSGVTVWLVSNVATLILIRTYIFWTANKTDPPLCTFVSQNLWDPFAEPSSRNNGLYRKHKTLQRTLFRPTDQTQHTKRARTFWLSCARTHTGMTCKFTIEFPASNMRTAGHVPGTKQQQQVSTSWLWGVLQRQSATGSPRRKKGLPRNPLQIRTTKKIYSGRGGGGGNKTQFGPGW
jgi:hypothetical protein